MKKQTTKNILMLSLIALFFLSATLVRVVPGAKQERKSEKVNETITRLQKFDTNRYLKEYEHKKRAKEMRESSFKRGLNQK